MCRFVLYLGQPIALHMLITDPKNSLIHQSFQSEEREEPLNGDGFGIAWYAPDVGPEPALFRSISPAWSNRNLLELARVTKSPCVLAHVRAASTPLGVSEVNCHPFTSGRLSFMHNGHVAGFQKLERRLNDALSDESYRAIAGSTDSEHLFGLFLDRLREEKSPDPAEALGQALRATIAQVLALARDCGITEASYLNLAVSDGRVAAAARFTDGPPEDADSLHVHTGKRYACEGGVCRMIHSDRGEQSVLVSSERLSDDPGWEDVPVNHILTVHEDRSVRARPCSLPPALGAGVERGAGPSVLSRTQFGRFPASRWRR